MADRKIIFEGKKVFVATRDGWEFVERKSAREAVAVVAETADGKVILTEQYRRSVDANVIDFPAGLVGDEGGAGDPGETAKKELEEETGWKCGKVELLAHGPTSPGITSEIVGFYRAVGLRQVGKGGGVGGEKITVHEVSRREMREWLKGKEDAGVLIDMKIWAGLYFLSQST